MDPLHTLGQGGNNRASPVLAHKDEVAQIKPINKLPEPGSVLVERVLFCVNSIESPSPSYPAG